MTRGGFLGGLLLGIAIGGAFALLYAPERGDKTRKKLSKRSEKWHEAANDVVGVAGEFVTKGRKRVGI